MIMGGVFRMAGEVVAGGQQEAEIDTTSSNTSRETTGSG